MSASENLQPATDAIKYEYTEKSECAKHEPIKYLVPEGFNNQTFNNDRQFVRFESNQQMFGGTNVGEQEISDVLEDRVATRGGETFRTPGILNSADPFERNQLYNNPFTQETLKSDCSGKETFRANSRDDKILDIALSIIIGILLIYVIYKFFIAKSFTSTPSQTGNEFENEVMVEEIEEA